MDRIKEYREALAKFCKGDVVMSIPVQPNDADIVLNECIDRLEGILQDTRQKNSIPTVRKPAKAGQGKT